MATAYIDRITDLGCKERDGVVVELRRKATIAGITTTDYTAAYDALTALDTEGITYNSNPDTGRGANLVLKERNPMINPQSKEVFEVELLYEHFQSEGQNLTSPMFSGVYIKLRHSLQQVTTNKYPADYGITETDETTKALKESLRGKEITVQHTWPDGTDKYTYTDENNVVQTLPADPDASRRGRTDIQTGELSVYEGIQQAEIGGIGQFEQVTSVAHYFLGRTNNAIWLGGQIGTWLCMSVDYQLYSQSLTEASRANFLFQFQYNIAGWKPTAAFIDERTGKPAAGLVVDVGLKTIPYQGEADYEKYWTIQG